jgi:antitoxin component of RelBE/YafQ-DinJ toxin-antitoxin module
MKRELLTVRIDGGLKTQYQQLAALRGMSVSDMLRQHMRESVQAFMQPATKATPPKKPPAPPHKPKRR